MIEGKTGMSVHRIRLAGPWESLSHENRMTSTCGARQPCQLPYEVTKSDGEDLGMNLFRRFHRPTGIGEFTRVCVGFEVHNLTLEVLINDGVTEVVGASAASRVNNANEIVRTDISKLLKSFNELQIRLSCIDRQFAGRVVSVWLEIAE